MHAGREKSMYHSWVAVTYLMICGAMLVLSPLFALGESDAEWIGYALVAAGALLGAFISGMVSPHRRLNEPATAGVAVVVTAAAVFSKSSFGAEVWAESKWMITGRLAFLAALALISALLGAFIGHRRAPAKPSTSKLLWGGVSTLLTGGFATVSMCAIFTLLVPDTNMASDEAELSGSETAIVFALLMLSCFVGPFITQLIAPTRLKWSGASGGFVLLLILGVVGLAEGGATQVFSRLFGLFFLGLLGLAVGRGGVSLAWRRLERRLNQHPIPPAQARAQEQ